MRTPANPDPARREVGPLRGWKDSRVDVRQGKRRACGGAPQAERQASEDAEDDGRAAAGGREARAVREKVDAGSYRGRDARAAAPAIRAQRGFTAKVKKSKVTFDFQLLTFS